MSDMKDQLFKKMSEYLTDEELENFIRNFESDTDNDKVTLNDVNSSPNEIILKSFDWIETPEGHLYWREICDRL